MPSNNTLWIPIQHYYKKINKLFSEKRWNYMQFLVRFFWTIYINSKQRSNAELIFIEMYCNAKNSYYINIMGLLKSWLMLNCVYFIYERISWISSLPPTMSWFFSNNQDQLEKHHININSYYHNRVLYECIIISQRLCSSIFSQ